MDPCEKKKTVLVPIIFLLSFCCCAQQILFRSYTVADGLTSNTVRAIAQDDQGYLWFGTKNGISRFDGYEFTSYQYKKDDPYSLGNNFIHSISKIDPAHLWIGTENGVYLLDLTTGRFSHYPPLIGMTVFDILKDGRGFIWMATRFNGLYRYRISNGQLLHITASEGLSSNNLTRLAMDNEGHLWVGTFGKGIDLLNGEGKRLATYSITNHLTSDFVISLYKDLSGNVWSGTMNGGVNVWDAKTKTFRNYRTTTTPAINDDIVRSIAQPSKGKIYIGTEKGLNELDLATNKIISYSSRTSDAYSLSDNAVYTIYPDRSGKVWVGTFFGGVNYFQQNSPAFESYYPTAAKNSLSGKAVSCFLEDGKGKFWVGTEDGGLDYFNSVDKSFKQYPFLPDQQKLSYHNVHALLKDRQGQLWVGLFASGINVVNTKTGIVKRYQQEDLNESSLNSDNVFSLYEDNEGEIWIGTDKGLNHYDITRDAFERIHQPGIENTIVYDVLEDAEKNIWIATYNNGLQVYNKHTGSWKSLTAGTTALSTNKLTCLHDDGNGNLWIGTDGGGLLRLNKQTLAATVFDGEKGIDANVVYSLIADDNGVLWIPTNNGLYSLRTGSGAVRHFTQSDNLQSRQFNYKAAYKSSSGDLLVGGVKGFNFFSPISVTTNKESGNVVLTGLQLFNKEVEPGKESFLRKAINYTSAIKLPYDQSVMSFSFAALDAPTPEKLFYAYKMEGFDGHWNFVRNNRKATYTNLPPGHYTLLIKATTDESNWGSAPCKLDIVITPPFYKTLWAYLVYALLFIAAVYFSYRYFIRYHRRKANARLDKLKQKEEQEFYARKIEFFTMMAHEIRTPLSLIMAPLEKLLILKNWEKEQGDQLKIMDENAERLMQLVNQLLDFRRIESDAYTIAKERVEVVSLVHSVYSRFRSLPFQKNIDFILSTNLGFLTTDADPEVLDKILSNLLINAFKFARHRVRLLVEERIDGTGKERLLSISVEDDGIGIPGSDIKNIFKKFFTVTSGAHQYHNLGGTGIGLALASALAEKHGGRLLVKSDEGVKTVFTLELPLKKDDDKPSGREEPYENEGQEGGEPLPVVLVVEDEVAIQNYIESNLVSEGYTVIKAGNGKEALAIIESQEVDLVLSDVMMPEMDGYALCRVVKSNVQFSHLPIILLTARGNKEAEIEGVQSGADTYITKPFKWKHLIAVVKNLLDIRKNLRERFSQEPSSGPGVLATNVRDKEFMEKVVSIVRSRMMDPQLSVEELGRDLAMSRSNLHKKLKSITGVVPNELIRLVRLKEAASLLTAGDHTMAEVAYLTGFGSPSYFAKCFVQQFGVRPKVYASQQKDKGIVSVEDYLKNPDDN